LSGFGGSILGGAATTGATGGVTTGCGATGGGFAGAGAGRTAILSSGGDGGVTIQPALNSIELVRTAIKRGCLGLIMAI
jgi:hypothetical protein